MRVKILCVAGARPNFIKIGPLMRILGADDRFDPALIHTGQHYDDNLSRVFFEDLAIPRPDIELEVGSGGHAEQTANIMTRFCAVLEREQPQAVLVVGDVNSTIACALAASKFHLDEAFECAAGHRTRPISIHVEAGLRSHDWDMPEEINRILTDRLSDLLFVTDPAGLENLKGEGVADDKVHYVGNVMIDSLLAAREKALSSDVLERLGLTEKGYGLVTLHRPSNVDDPAALADRLGTLDKVAEKLPLVFPVHPRTKKRMSDSGVTLDDSRWTLTEPVGYHDFVKLMSAARAVVSDSGGIQEETTILGVPCVTLRENTERPVTIHEGTNILAGVQRDRVLAAFDEAMAMEPSGRVPRLWDGGTAGRIRDILAQYFAL